MDLAQFPRRRYTSGWTPLEWLGRLTETLGGPAIYVKRDDLLGLAAGGNKTRKLEFLVADALAQGADTLITCGALQSNHCRLTAAAAAKEGLRCRLILEEPRPQAYDPRATGNNLLFQLLGVERIKVVAKGEDLMGEMRAEAEALATQGRKGYVIPVGGSTAVGALGYVACAQEILSQTFEEGVRIDRVVCASGSAGTHAGLLVGLLGMNSPIPILGINVSRPKGPQEEKVWELARETAALLGVQGEIPRDSVACFDEYVGPGYAVPTSAMVEAVRLVARTEAILLDPVYTGKAMAGLMDLIRKEYFPKDENVLFLHTGGTPALYAYTEHLRAS